MLDVVLVQVLSNEMEHLKKIGMSMNLYKKNIFSNLKKNSLKLGTLFYAVNPYEYMFKDVSDIPKTDVFAQVLNFKILDLQKFLIIFFFLIKGHALFLWICNY